MLKDRLNIVAKITDEYVAKYNLKVLNKNKAERELKKT